MYLFDLIVLWDKKVNKNRNGKTTYSASLFIDSGNSPTKAENHIPTMKI